MPAALQAILQTILEHPDFPRHPGWRREEFTSGQSIIDENDTSRDLFFIESGLVRVNRNIEVTEGRHMQSGLLELGAGDVFGELSLFGDVTRSASVIALTEGVLIRLEGNVLAAFMDQHMALGYALLKEFFIRHSAALSHSNERYSALYARHLRSDEGC